MHVRVHLHEGLHEYVHVVNDEQDHGHGEQNAAAASAVTAAAAFVISIKRMAAVNVNAIAEYARE